MAAAEAAGVAEIAELLTMPLSTVSVVLKREGLGKLSPAGAGRASQSL
ncbi:MAG: hypothetical protein QOF13_1970 [Solirubrobacterales bacterium]|jgi:hypothetical protein|nr:hypothetical protein [Solirubrobacterales bacterium]